MGTLYPDQDLLNPLPQTEYPYPEPSHTSLTTEIPPLFPALESLSTGQGYDRTLPDPTSRSQLSNSNMAAASSEMLPSSIFPSVTNGKSKNRWLSHNETSSRSQASSRTISSLTGMVNPMSHMKSASLTAHDVFLKYMTMDNNAPPPPPAALNAYGRDRANNADDFRAPADIDLTSLPKDDDSEVSVESCSPQMYGYSTSENSGRRSRVQESPSSSTLMSGMEYRRPENRSYDLLHAGTEADFRATSDIYKTSIPSVSNTSGY
ncbi:hypothetical protein Plec18167_004435 [Paecilomyces lecythidis]|uniref:Uncharacterized protein n=1 Tax=Paecilomyces lecythidis TaxID=3004212 RepID=A0ABR3XQU1_9EURO